MTTQSVVATKPSHDSQNHLQILEKAIQYAKPRSLHPREQVQLQASWRATCSLIQREFSTTNAYSENEIKSWLHSLRVCVQASSFIPSESACQQQAMLQYHVVRRLHQLQVYKEATELGMELLNYIQDFSNDNGPSQMCTLHMNVAMAVLSSLAHCPELVTHHLNVVLQLNSFKNKTELHMKQMQSHVLNAMLCRLKVAERDLSSCLTAADLEAVLPYVLAIKDTTCRNTTLRQLGRGMGLTALKSVAIDRGGLLENEQTTLLATCTKALISRYSSADLNDPEIESLCTSASEILHSSSALSVINLMGLATRMTASSAHPAVSSMWRLQPDLVAGIEQSLAQLKGGCVMCAASWCILTGLLSSCSSALHALARHTANAVEVALSPLFELYTKLLDTATNLFTREATTSAVVDALGAVVAGFSSAFSFLGALMRGGDADPHVPASAQRLCLSFAGFLQLVVPLETSAVDSSKQSTLMLGFAAEVRCAVASKELGACLFFVLN